MGENGIEVIKRIIIGCRRNKVSFGLYFRFESQGLRGVVPVSRDVVVAVPFIPESFPYLGQNTATILECARGEVVQRL